MFGLIFALVGGAGSLVLVSGALESRAFVKRAVEAECTVTRHEIRQEQDSDGDTMYRPYVHYVRVDAGREYVSDRVGLSTPSTSMRSYAEGVINRFPVGERVPCFFDPQDPGAMVLDRSLTGAFLLALFPMAFLLIGVAVMTTSFFKAGTDEDGLPSRKAWRERMLDAGELVLTPRTGLLFKTLFSAGFALSFGGVGVWLVTEAWFSGAISMGLFALIFAGVGLGMGVWCLSNLLLMIGPRVRLVLDKPTVHLGDSIRMRYDIRSPAPLLGGYAELVGQEESTYTRGTDTHTDTAVFYRKRLFDIDVQSGTARAARGTATVAPPRASMHSFDAGRNKIIWLIRLEIEVDWWPDVDREYELGVEPAAIKRRSRR